MIRTLAKQSVQDWGLLGLRPMHRALVRRSVEQMVANHQRPMPSQQAVAWHLQQWGEDCEPLQLTMFNRAGVLLVDRAGLLQRVHLNRQNDPVLAELHCRSHPQIRLLWNWSIRGRQDLVWCTELSFDGVINDARSLLEWLPVCLTRGRSYDRQRNGLLRDLHLPTLVAPITIPR